MNLTEFFLSFYHLTKKSSIFQRFKHKGKKYLKIMIHIIFNGSVGLKYKSIYLILTYEIIVYKIFMSNSLKPINLIFFDSYVLFIIYLAVNWNAINCSTYSNIWQLCYYVVLVLRLGIDEAENSQVIGRKCFLVLIFISSLVLVGMGVYEMYTIYMNPSYFAVDTTE